MGHSSNHQNPIDYQTKLLSKSIFQNEMTCQMKWINKHHQQKWDWACHFGCNGQ
jgi:hypothetical protein